MLKLMKVQTLRKLQSRLSISVAKDNIYLASGNANRPIYFKLIVSNPTPWEISITGIDCSIGYEYIVFERNCRPAESLPIQIPAEAVQGQAFFILYEPFLTILGLPTKRKGWFIQGQIIISSDFGAFALPIPLSEHLEVGTNDTVWNEQREWIQKTIKGGE